MDSFAYEQYLQLNLRLQKSLISDFDIESATQSAIDVFSLQFNQKIRIGKLI
jgi:hypothetical protein